MWLRRGEVAGAITSRVNPLQGCDCFALGSLRYIATASPDFVAHYFADGVSAKALAQAPALTFSEKDRLQRDWAHQMTGRAVELRTHFIASSQGFVTAALLGMGWGMNPEFLVKENLCENRLVPVAPDAPMDTPLSWQVPRISARALAPVTEAIKRVAKSELIQP